MVDGGEAVIEVPLVALAARMTRWAVGGRRFHPFVYFSASHCVARTGWSASAFFSLVVKSLKTHVRPVWFCGAVLDGSGRFFPNHRQNQTRALFSTCRYIGVAMTRDDFTYTA